MDDMDDLAVAAFVATRLSTRPCGPAGMWCVGRRALVASQVIDVVLVHNCVPLLSGAA